MVGVRDFIWGGTLSVGLTPEKQQEIMKLWSQINKYENALTRNDFRAWWGIKLGGTYLTSNNAIKFLKDVKTRYDTPYNEKMTTRGFYTNNGTVRRNLLNNQDAITYNKVNLNTGVILVGYDEQLPARIYNKKSINMLVKNSKKDPISRQKIRSFIPIPNDIKKAIKEQRKELIVKISQRTTYKTADLKNMSIPDLILIPLDPLTTGQKKRTTLLTNLLNNYHGNNYTFKPKGAKKSMPRNALNYYIATHKNTNKISVKKDKKKIKMLMRNGNTWSNTTPVNNK